MAAAFDCGPAGGAGAIAAGAGGCCPAGTVAAGCTVGASLLASAGVIGVIGINSVCTVGGSSRRRM